MTEVDIEKREVDDGKSEEKPLVSNAVSNSIPTGAVPPSSPSKSSSSPSTFADAISSNPDFFAQASKFSFCFVGLLLSYLTWGYMQELIMTTKFEPTQHSPDGTFPSAAFCVFSNRFLAIIVAMIAVKLRHGSIFQNNVAPLKAFTPCALSNTMSSWSQYASLRYVTFPVQTVFKSSKIIPVMIMGKALKGAIYPTTQYVEALFITIGVAIFSVFAQEAKEGKAASTAVMGLIYMLMYICFDCFTSQWQSKIYDMYGRQNVDPYQMMLGVNSSAICITTAGLILSGDFPVVYEFFLVNPNVLVYNVITAITSASGQLFIYYTIKEFGPIVFTIIMTVRQMISICISAYKFGHVISPKAMVGAILVFGVLFYQIRRKWMAKKAKDSADVPAASVVGGGVGNNGSK
uniref:Sugar phosphate transporter domain-containing protein n=1 Tax=Chaetoceros debilis TaxID=122233 RepID=A0A7S3Q0G0_9STRA